MSSKTFAQINRTCNHELGILSDMITVAVSPDFYIRRCRICNTEEEMRRAGKMWVGYSLEAESLRDFDRRKYAKEILQPKDRRGGVNELFEHAYGNPYKKAKIGTDIEKYRVKDKKK